MFDVIITYLMMIVNNAARFYSLFMSFFKRPQKFLKKSCFES